MRMYPEDIVKFFDMAPVGMKVTVVDQPILVGWLNDGLYLEANPSQTQSSQLEYDEEMELRTLNDGLRKVIIDAAGVESARINWDVVEKVVRERRGYPVLITESKGGKSPTKEKTAKPAENRQQVKYN